MSRSAGLRSHSVATSECNLQECITENLAPENLDFQVPQLTLAQRKYVNITFPHFILVMIFFKYLIDYAFSGSSTTVKSRYVVIVMYTTQLMETTSQWNPKSYLLILNIMWDMAISQHIFKSNG